MAANYIDSKQAAEMLGMTESKLNDLRLSGEIHAMRDGANWKFKVDEVERLAEELGISLGDDESDSLGDDESDSLGGEESDADDDEIRLEEDAAGGDSGITGLALDLEDEGDDLDDIDSPTVIGKGDSPEDDSSEDEQSGDDDEISLSDEPSPKDSSTSDVVAEESELGLGDSGLQMPEEGGSAAVSLDGDDVESELGLDAGQSDMVIGGSDLQLDGSDVGSGSLDFEGSSLDLESDVSLGEDDDLAVGDDDDLAVGDDDDVEIGSGIGSASSNLDLDDDGDDDDLVLEGGSDVTQGAGDTGINIGAPTDSGLNLEEEPLDLAGSSVSSLELPEDEDIIDLDDLEADPDESTQLKADEDFQLAPSVAELDDDADDSGSQVIALEDSEAFGTAVAAGPGVAQPEADELEGALEEGEMAPVTQPALPDVRYAPLPEKPYSVWNVVGLLMIVLLLAVTGMLMTDLVRNIWSWDATYSASTPIMDGIAEMFGLDP